jgi:hypothetical protein
MLEMILNSKAAAAAAGAAFAPEPSQTFSGGPFDARAFSGAGANWTVSTGRAVANGAAFDPVAAAYGPGVVDAQTIASAGSSPLVMVGLFLALLLMTRGHKGA